MDLKNRDRSKRENPKSRANAEMSKCALMHPPYGRCKNACGALSLQLKVEKYGDIIICCNQKRE